jgi:peptidoglycan hydrolase CwlO-like protein
MALNESNKKLKDVQQQLDNLQKQIQNPVRVYGQ